MRKVFITLIIVLLAVGVSYGQNQPEVKYSSLVLTTGIEHVSLKDQTFSPTVFSGNIPHLGLGFSRNVRDEKLWNALVSVGLGSIDYRVKNFESTFIEAELSINHLSKIKSYSRSQVFVGGQFRSVLNVLDHQGFASGSWFTAQQLEALVQYTYSISENQTLTGQFSYPIVGLLGRPGYIGIDEFVVVNSDNIPKILYSRLRLQSLDKLIHPDLRVNYSHETDKVILSASVNYSYLQVNSIRTYQRNKVGVNVMINFKLGQGNEK